MADDLATRIERLRRATRNSDVLAVCDAVAGLQAENTRLTAEVARLTAPKPPFVRKTYMREYMKRRRQGGRQKTAGT